MKAAIEKTTRIGRTMSLCLGLAAVVVMAVLLSLTAFADTAEAKKKKAKQVEKIVFSSDQASGEGVNNPTGDLEIFIMNPDGTELKQLTFNTASDNLPTLSPDGQKIAYRSLGIQASNPEGDFEVYVMKALDGSGQRNLTNTASGEEFTPDFSPDGKKIAYETEGAQASNPEGDTEVYVMKALDGSSQLNLTNTASGIGDFEPNFGKAKKG